MLNCQARGGRKILFCLHAPKKLAISARGEIHFLIRSNLIKTIVLVNFISVSLRRRQSSSDVDRAWVEGLRGGGDDTERERGSTEIIELKLNTNCFMNTTFCHTQSKCERERETENKWQKHILCVFDESAPEPCRRS